MTVLINIKTYIYFTLLLLKEETAKKLFLENVVNKTSFLDEENDNKKFAGKLQKNLIYNINKIIKDEKVLLSIKERFYLKGLKNYLSQIKNVVQEDGVDIKTLTDRELKDHLQLIVNSAGTVKGKIKLKNTGEIIEIERNKKSARLDFFDKLFSFNFIVKKESTSGEV